MYVSVTEKIFREIIYLVISCVKTKFLPKKCESMYVNFYDTILHCEPISIFHCKEQNKKICVKIVSTYCLMVNFGRTECL